jgi:hypothetical protein
VRSIAFSSFVRVLSLLDFEWPSNPVQLAVRKTQLQFLEEYTLLHAVLGNAVHEWLQHDMYRRYAGVHSNQKACEDWW